YEAETKILVESQQIRPDLAAPTVTASPEERLQIIQQRLTTRDNLLAIARKFDLYHINEQAAVPSAVVDKMQAATQIEQLDLDALTQTQQAAARRRSGAQAIAFTASFDYSDPVIAARVANEFGDSILQQNLETRANRAAETQKFFKDQVANYDKR